MKKDILGNSDFGVNALKKKYGGNRKNIRQKYGDGKIMSVMMNNEKVSMATLQILLKIYIYICAGKALGRYYEQIYALKKHSKTHTSVYQGRINKKKDF